MWMILVLVVTLSVTGYYSMVHQRSNPPPAPMQSMALAGNMGTYREAVVTYLKTNPVPATGAVDNNLLSTIFPSWYSPNPLWTNYIAPAPDRTIVIYASQLPPTNIAADIASLSKNSVLVGTANSTTNTIDSPVFSNNDALRPPVPLPTGAAGLIPHGSPVWLTYRQ